MLIDVGDLKSARELLCTAQNALARDGMRNSLSEGQQERIGVLIEQIDILRPIGSDGKHGDKHTLWCGCDGIVQDDLWEIVNENMLTRAIHIHNSREDVMTRYGS